MSKSHKKSNKKIKKNKLKNAKIQCHHVDANIVISAFDPNDINRDKCYEFLNNLVHNRNGCVCMCMCIITFGEVHAWIGKNNVKDCKSNADSFLSKYIFNKMIKIYSITDKDVSKFDELRNIEKHCDAPELIALAVAINNRGTVFISNDNNINSDKLKNHLKETIKLKSV